MSLRKGLQRLEGVADAKLVLKPPHMAVRMKPGYWPNLPKMWQKIKDAGYTPISENVDLVVIGKLVGQGDRLAIALDKMRSPVTLLVTAARDDPDTALQRHVGQSVEVEGHWQPSPSGEAGPGTLALTAIHSADDKR